MMGACTILQYFIYVRTYLLNEWLIIYLELGFKLYIVLIFCGSIWTLVSIFVYMDVFYIDACVGKWIFMLKWCLKCIFEHLYFYIWCSEWNVCLFFVFIFFETYLLFPEKLYCYSFCKMLSLCMYYLMFS